MSTPPGSEIKDYALAVGRVRFMGEPVAAVCARTRELARDAAELVAVEYEPLDVLVDARVAVKNETVMHEDAGSNVVWSGVFDWGDWEAAKAEADKIVRIDELHFHRFSSTPSSAGRPRRVRPRRGAVSAARRDAPGERT